MAKLEQTVRPEMALAPKRTRIGAFERILCGVDGGRGAREAARQAAVLAGPDGHVDFVSAACVRGYGLNAQAVLSPVRAEKALRRAAAIAKETGTPADWRIVRHPDATGVLLTKSVDYDLLVVGTHGGTRFAGIVIGSTGSELVHRANAPVLVARRHPHAVAFPVRVVVASDASVHAERAVALALRLCAAYDPAITVVAPHSAGATATRFEALGIDVSAVDYGDEEPRIAIVDAARAFRASLIVVGSRGLGGLRALGSVSERVAHDAPCSVLVARPRG